MSPAAEDVLWRGGFHFQWVSLQTEHLPPAVQADVQDVHDGQLEYIRFEEVK